MVGGREGAEGGPARPGPAGRGPWPPAVPPAGPRPACLPALVRGYAWRRPETPPRPLLQNCLNARWWLNLVTGQGGSVAARAGGCKAGWGRPVRAGAPGPRGCRARSSRVSPCGPAVMVLWFGTRLQFSLELYALK